MAIELGYTPNKGNLVLSEGADWVCSLQEKGVTWPEGTTCRLEFPDLDSVGPYSATVSEETATAAFVLQETDTRAADIPAGTKFRIYLVKDDDFLWFYGAVKRYE